MGSLMVIAFVVAGGATFVKIPQALLVRSELVCMAFVSPATGLNVNWNVPPAAAVKDDDEIGGDDGLVTDKIAGELVTAPATFVMTTE